MKLIHETTEQSGLIGGKSYIVSVRVELDFDEKRIFSSGYSVYDTIELGDRFSETKGVSTIGTIHLAEIIGREKTFKLPSIHKASDFVDVLKEGLQRARRQILATGSCIDAVGKRFEDEIE